MRLHIVVVVAHHGIDEDGVDERHADDTTQQKEQTEIKTHHIAPKRGGDLRNGIGNLIPPFHRANPEDRIDGLQRGSEILRSHILENHAVHQTKDKDNDEKRQENGPRLPHRQPQILYQDGKVGEEPPQPKHAHDTEQPEYQQYREIEIASREEEQYQRRDGQKHQYAIQSVPSRRPIAMESIIDVLDNHLHNENDGATQVDEQQVFIMNPAFLKKNDNGVENDDEQYHLLVQQKL